jgi:hypothetical protein
MSKDTHKTKDGRTAKKGLYYYINKKRKEGRKMRKPGTKGSPSSSDFKAAARTAKTHGGELHGGQKKLDKNKDGKLSGVDFKMMKHGGEVLSGNANRRRQQQGG